MSAERSDRLALAARNIARQIGEPPARRALVVASPGKAPLAEAVRGVLDAHGLAAVRQAPGSAEDLRRALAAGEGLVLLLEPPDAPLLFALLGRPDEAPEPPAESPPHLFCDWLLPAEGVERTWGVDLEEVIAFRRWLLSRLEGAREIHVATPAGTDLRLAPRAWLSWPSPVGEVYTAPLEDSVEGLVVVDGVAYGGPVARRFSLRIEGGRIVNLADLDRTDPQQRMAYDDLTRDPNASRVAELGIGINPGARVDADIMEAEQARGTCHVGFGRNVAYGGATESAFHGDFSLLIPTIVVDGRMLCREGEYLV